MPHEKQNFAAVIISLNSNASKSAIAKSVRMNLEKIASGEVSYLHQLEFEVNRRRHSIIRVRIVAVIVTIESFVGNIVVPRSCPLAIGPLLNIP
jgi:hypothetical protein